MAEQVRLSGSLRWFSSVEHDRGLERIPATAHGVCEGLRAGSGLTIESSAPVTVDAAENTAVAIRAVLGTGRAVVIHPAPSTASDDFGYLAERVPGV